MSASRTEPLYYVRCRDDWWALYHVQVSDPDRTVVFFVSADGPPEDVPIAHAARLRGVAQQLARKEDAGWARDEHAYSYR